MPDVIDILLGILCVAILIGGAAWQRYLLCNDTEREEPPWRVLIPLALGALITCGAVIAWILVLLDDRSEISGKHAFARIFVCLAIAIVFNIKNYLAPIFLAVSLCWTVWIFGHYGEFSIIPIVTLVADWAASYGPKWIEPIYTASVFLYTAFSGITAFTTSHSPS